MAVYAFDERNIEWGQIDWLKDLWFYVYDVDRENGIVDVIFKFGAHSRAMLHRHKCPYLTFVVQGELRLYRTNGELKEVRPAGSYVKGSANGEPHLEGGGDEDAIVFFSNRNVEDALYEFLDENGQEVVTLRIGDFEEALRSQGRARWLPAA